MKFSTVTLPTLWAEPLIYAGDYIFTVKNCGPVTRQVLLYIVNSDSYDKAFKAAMHEGKRVIIDTRLTKGDPPGEFTPSDWSYICSITSENGWKFFLRFLFTEALPENLLKEVA